MLGMEKQSKFLPDRVSGALKSMIKRISGGVLVLLGLWAFLALIFYNPYLDGFSTASTFGNQSIMGQVAGFFKYAVGFIPAMFVFFCVARLGLTWLVGWEEEFAPEYNFLRGFVTLCVGAAGMGLIMPSANFGGFMGFLVAEDVSSIIGSWGLVLGIVFVGLFLVLSAKLLHIKWEHVKNLISFIKKSFRWLMSIFHLGGGANYSATEYEEEPEYDEEVVEEEEEEPQKIVKKQASKKKKVKSVKAPVVETGEHEYELPDPAFLERSSFGKNVVTPELKRNASAMEIHFAEYGVRGRVVGIRPGPIVTLYEFMPESGVRMVDINKTVKDMTRAMATENIRIAHIPSTQLIGVEMVNLNRQMVRYQSLVDNETFINSKYRIPLALGVDIGGNPMYFDLAKMPHVLIAGRTGSGKSVFVQSIIMSILYHFTPDRCKLMIVDPKGVDFTLWDNIPHLITPVLTDANASVNALKWSVREMEERYKRLQLLGVQNIEGYNEAVGKKRANGEKLTRQVAVGTDPETGELEFETQEVDLSDMPYLVIIIDEVADLMSVARKEVEACVQRLAQKARAAGIHLVAATQRPDTSVITGVIKANFPTRISFQARSAIDSMTTLGEKGAEQLLACGDMLFSEAGRVPVRIHGAFIENTEINRVADFLREQGEPEYVAGISESDDSSFAGAGAAIPGMAPSKSDKDADLYTQAKEYVLRDKKPTISYIQRRLGVGYNKAAGFMERMEEEGIVSPPDANNKRHIL